MTVRARCLLICLAILGAATLPSIVGAQESDAVPPEAVVPDGMPADGQLTAGSTPNATWPASRPAARLNLLDLLISGGPLMIPIAAMSVLMVMLIIQLLLKLRRNRVAPLALVEGLAELGGVPRVLDPRRAYRLCQQHPSATASVIRAMLLKIGRPQSEVEHAVAEASEREAERMYSSVRWLTFISAITPLMGLFGTVWGMIRAFFDTTQLQVGQNKADFLSAGIYVALVTTLAGLAVAIPAAIFAHYFEGRILRLFHEIDELLFSLLPQVERFEGRIRVTPHTLGGADELPSERAGAAEPAGSDSARVG